MKLGIVVQRYGPDVVGGAELHAREFAWRLSRFHEIEILTSCARDYVTWRNYYEPGREQDGPVRVLRFRVARERNLELFSALSHRLFHGGGAREDEERWFEENGPVMPDLLHHLRTHGSEYDGFIFFSYRYWHCYFGLPLVAERSLLVPTAEEDAVVRLKVVRELFRLPRCIVHNSPEERDLLRAVCIHGLAPGVVVGCGVDEPLPSPSASHLEKLRVQQPYVLALGRVDRNKGSEALRRTFRAAHSIRAWRLQLVFAGQATMTVQDDEFVRYVGFVNEEQRAALLKHSIALVNPSPFESLSLVLLESWNYDRPVVVNGHCAAMRGQVCRANGGLYYESFDDLVAVIEWLVDNPERTRVLGRQGHAFVDQEYRWPTVMQRLEGVIREYFGQHP